MKETYLLRPFTKFCCTIGNIPTSYMISLSYEEQLLWLCDYLKNTVIPAINNNAEAITEVQTLVTTLQNTIKDYTTQIDNLTTIVNDNNEKVESLGNTVATYDSKIENLQTSLQELKDYVYNLDVSEQVKNQIDSMIESGELTEKILGGLNLDTTIDTTTNLINSTNTYKEGQVVHTLGYYNVNDKGNANFIIHNSKPTNKFVITLNNGQFAEMIVDDYLNAKACGAKGNGTNDDSGIINNIISFMKNSDIKKLYFPSGNYIINNTVTIYSDMTLFSDNKFQTNFTQGSSSSMLDKPLFQTDITNGVQNEHITFQNLGFVGTGARTQYTIDIINCHSFILDNCNFSVSGNTVNKFHAINFDKSATNPQTNFLTTIKFCRFSKTNLRMNSTDSYIVNNELWGNENIAALSILNAGNSIINNNQFVGGSTYGGIYIHNANEGLKITNNYFDGSYPNINTQYGIYATGYLTNCLISNNNFWYQKNGGLFLEQISSSNITNNIFQECDYYNNGSPDIFIGAQSFANNLSGNSFFRTNYYDTSTSSVKTRSTDNPPPAIQITNLQNYPDSQINNNTTLYDQYYGMIQYAGAVIAKNNVSSKLYVPYNINTDNVKNYNEIVVNNPTNLLTRNLQINSSRKFRVDNPINYLVNDFEAFNIDTVYTQDLNVCLNTTHNVMNKPSFMANDRLHYIQYHFINTRLFICYCLGCKL